MKGQRLNPEKLNPMEMNSMTSMMGMMGLLQKIGSKKMLIHLSSVNLHKTLQIVFLYL